MTLKEMAQLNGESGILEAENNNVLGQAKIVMQKSRNRQLQELFPAGFGKLVESLVSSKFIFVNSLVFP